ncbi:MAG: twitching motility protein PilT [Lachnospiraceae bacterium]|nr:twitching motility protein PilT [Lachnospiraceae bacterium]
MVQLIVGNKGKGKTKLLLDRVNKEVKTTLGNICYLDKSTKHMFELNNRVRLINVSDFMIEDTDQFLGFVAGIISQDHDLEQMYFDSFLSISHIDDKDISGAIAKLQKYSDAFHVDFYLSVSMDEKDVPEDLRNLIDIKL